MLTKVDEGRVIEHAGMLYTVVGQGAGGLFVVGLNYPAPAAIRFIPETDVRFVSEKPLPKSKRTLVGQMQEGKHD